MGKTTTAAPRCPAVGTRPSCVTAVGRFAVGKWCGSRAHTSTFTASPVKVINNTKTLLAGLLIGKKRSKIVHFFLSFGTF